MSGGLRILVLGSGGREHALAWRLARDPEVKEVLVAPGNDGIARRFTCLPGGADDAAALRRSIEERKVDLVLVGPEAPLAAGLADALRAIVPVFGPGADGARLEASKWFAKRLMLDAGVPTAPADLWESPGQAFADLARCSYPVVLKADGLAAGKGVCVAADRVEAEAFVRRVMVERSLGEAGARVLREDYLAGEEISLMVITDGERYRELPAARDYKRAMDGDRGPNTGGMGAYAPSPRLDDGLEREIGSEVVEPTLRALRSRGISYRGVLYAGLMLTDRGVRVLEFNCRFGDPETEAVLPLLEESLAAVVMGAARGHLEGPPRLAWRGAAVSVVLADEGYPETVRGRGVIEGLEALEAAADLVVFHAGTQRSEAGWRVSGGRAAHVVARGETVPAARARVYQAIDGLGGAGWRVRRDIAADVSRGAAVASPGRR
jgi:phosphoribosylamine--glycine ligase